jgi:predicted acyl esterase
VRPDFIRLAIGWFDHYLRAGPQVTAPGIVEYQDDTGAWHTAPSWPPPAESVPLYLSGQELIANRSGVKPSQRSFLAIGATSAEILPDPLKPRITVVTGDRLPGSLSLPVVTGKLRFR